MGLASSLPPREEVDWVFSGPTLNEILARLFHLASGTCARPGPAAPTSTACPLGGGPRAWARTALGDMLAGSPLAIALSLRLTQLGRSLSLKDALTLEMRVMVRCLIDPRSDMVEGISAKLVHKDQTPPAWHCPWPAALLDAFRSLPTDSIAGPGSSPASAGAGAPWVAALSAELVPASLVDEFLRPFPCWFVKPDFMLQPGAEDFTPHCAPQAGRL